MSNQRRRIEEEYSSYSRGVMNPKAGSVQRKETRQAFFAGAASMMSMLNSATDSTDEEQRELMRDLGAEIVEFWKSIRADCDAGK